MNRTEHDVRRALETPTRPDTVERLTDLIHDLAEIADRPATWTLPARLGPNADTSVAPGSRRGGARRRWIAPALVAAAVIAIAATTTIVVSGGGRTNNSPVGAATAKVQPTISTPDELRPVWLVSNATVPGFTITRDDYPRLGPGTSFEQGGLIRSTPEGGASGDFALEPPAEGGYAHHVATTPGGIHVVVGGRAGYFVPGTHVSPGRLNPAIYARPWDAAADSRDDQPELAVQHANGRWILINGTFGFSPATYDYNNDAALTIMKKIDVGLRVGVRHTVTVPFRLAGLPHHVTPEATSLLSGVPCLGYGTGAGPYPGEYTGSVMTVCRVKTGSDRAATLRPTGVDETQVGAVVIRSLQDGTSLIVEVDGGQLNKVSKAEAQQLANQADVAPTLDKTSTWLPVT